MAHSVMLLLFVVCRLISTVGLTVEPAELLLQLGLQLGGSGELSLDPSDVAAATADFGGGLAEEAPPPVAVVRPGSAEDVAAVVRAAFGSAAGFPVSARGHGHSTNGQARAPGGVVVEMSRRSGGGRLAPPEYSAARGEYYVDVWGGELWVDVLNWTLANGGLAPKSWTDYLYLSVGGTLSNGGISGQAFHHGPQISNVHELDVVTGKGELMTCSEEKNSELFHGVLGGLGQFGIITRARIALERAPQRVRWIRVLYSDFGDFSRDQERLISLHGRQRFDYVEGFVIVDVDEGLINNWRSSFFSPKNPVKISSIGAGNGDGGGVLYCLEMTKNYDDEYSTADSVDQAVEELLRELSFIPASVFTTDLQYVDFLDRVHRAELKLRDRGMWDVPHPWLNLFVPASRIADFDRGVFRGILENTTSGPILIYPMNKHKWNERSSAVVPEEEEEEEVFYLVAFLRSALPNSGDSTQSLEFLNQQNQEILQFCKRARIEIKQYLPHHTSRDDWVRHFGPKWDRFLQRKAQFDPKCILGRGQGIFQTSSSSPYSLLRS